VFPGIDLFVRFTITAVLESAGLQIRVNFGRKNKRYLKMDWDIDAPVPDRTLQGKFIASKIKIRKILPR